MRRNWEYLSHVRICYKIYRIFYRILSNLLNNSSTQRNLLQIYLARLPKYWSDISNLLQTCSFPTCYEPLATFAKRIVFFMSRSLLWRNFLLAKNVKDSAILLPTTIALIGLHFAANSITHCYCRKRGGEHKTLLICIWVLLHVFS